MSNISGGSGVDLWGVATTTSGGTENGDEEEHRMGDRMGEEEDREGRSGLMMVKGLERRMERLEESIGRLLVSFSLLLLLLNAKTVLAKPVLLWWFEENRLILL